MPFAAQTQMDDPNDPRKNAQGGVNISGQSNSVTTNLPGQDAAAAAGGEKSKSSGQYTNIQTYLDANKQQGDAMGTKISDDIGAKAEDASQKIQKFETAAPKVAEYDPNEVLGRATALNADEQNQYKTTKKTGGYTGPADISGVEGYADVNKQATQVAGLVENVGTEAGQRDLLKNTYARPSYSAGENNLDQALVQGSSGSRAKLETLGQKYAGISDALSAANTKVGGAINQANAQALKNKQAFAPAESNAWNTLLNPIQGRVEQANRDNPALIKRIQEDAADNIFNDETMNMLGLTEGQRIWDMNIGNYVNANTTQANVDNVANAAERSKYAALQALIEDSSRNEISANGKEIKPIEFDKTKYDADLAAKTAEMNRIMAETRLAANGNDIKYVRGAGNQYPEQVAVLRGNGTSSNSIQNQLDNVGPAYDYTQDSNLMNSFYKDAYANGAVTTQAGTEMRNALQGQTQSQLYSMITNWLDQNNYNRTIKKG